MEPRGLRADAERNRERILEAAREVFAEQGLQASTNEVARRAGVGVATLFRRFPSRDDLVGAVFADKMRAYVDAVDTALAEVDAWQGFCGYIERMCEMQAEDRGFADVLILTFPTAKALEADRNRAFDGLGELIARAKATGRLREDFVHQDVPLILMANAGVVTATRNAAPDAWRRIVGYLVQSFAAEAARPLPPPPARTQVIRALMGETRHRLMVISASSRSSSTRVWAALPSLSVSACSTSCGLTSAKDGMGWSWAPLPAFFCCSTAAA